MWRMRNVHLDELQPRHMGQNNYDCKLSCFFFRFLYLVCCSGYAGVGRYGRGKAIMSIIRVEKVSS